MKKTPLRFVVVATALTILAPQVRAQDMYPNNFAQDNINVIMSTHIDGLSLKNIAKKNAAKKGSSYKGSGVSTSKTRRITRGSTTYTPSATVSEQTRQQFVQQIRVASPNEASVVAADLKKFNPNKVWSQIVASYGLKPNDMADAVTAHWVLNYLIVKDKQDLDAATVQGLRQQLHRILATTPELAQLSDAQKQRATEQMYLRFVYQHAAFLKANKPGNETFKSQLRQAAETQFQKEMGINLQNVTLTTGGVSIRS